MVKALVAKVLRSGNSETPETVTQLQRMRSIAAKLNEAHHHGGEHDLEWWNQLSELSKSPAIAKYVSTGRLDPIVLQPHRRENRFLYATPAAGATTLIFQDEHKILLENERLKSQLISERRLSMLANQTNRELKSQNEKLLDGVCELTRVNKAMQSVLVADRQARVCLHETHHGTVTEAVGDQVEVTYETTDGPLKQLYHRNQFVFGKCPKEGDSIQANVIVAAEDVSVRTTDEQSPSSDLPAFRSKGITGRIEI